MAVFFKNDCKFNGCGKTFPTLSSLVEHIEAVHINFDPKVTAEFEDHCSVGIPLSYVLKYSHCRQISETTSADVRIRLIQHATRSCLDKQTNALGYQKMKTEEIFSESESSNDSWTPTKEINLPERKNATSSWLYKDKPFGCSVPGCKKRYKNINGIKYHYKNGHKIFEKPKRTIKHVSSKRNKGHRLKISTKKLFQDKTLAMHRCADVALSKISPISNDSNGLKWIGDNEDCRLTVSEQEDMQKLIQLRTNNNEFCPIDFTSAYTNTITNSTPWPAVASNTPNELTIRTCMENNRAPNTYVTYFNGCSDSQNICT